MNGLAALAFIVLFSQCAGKADNQVATTPASANAELSGMKIAYVEIDTLLAKYNFCIDLIFSNTGFDNLLYADSAYNITKEIVDGLNARYSSAKK